MQAGAQTEVSRRAMETGDFVPSRWPAAAPSRPRSCRVVHDQLAGADEVLVTGSRDAGAAGSGSVSHRQRRSCRSSLTNRPPSRIRRSNYFLNGIAFTPVALAAGDGQRFDQVIRDDRLDTQLHQSGEVATSVDRPYIDGEPAPCARFTSSGPASVTNGWTADTSATAWANPSMSVRTPQDAEGSRPSAAWTAATCSPGTTRRSPDRSSPPRQWPPGDSRHRSPGRARLAGRS